MTAIYFSSHACHASDLVEGSEEEIYREAAFWDKYLSEEAFSAAMSLVGVTGTVAQMKSQQLSRFHQALVRYKMHYWLFNHLQHPECQVPVAERPLLSAMPAKPTMRW